MHQLTRPSTKSQPPALLRGWFYRYRTRLFLGFVILMAGCAAVLDTSRYGFREAVTNRVVEGSLFKHRLVAKPGEGSVLHVYIEGDGRPWATRITRAQNPTPDRALTLDLMAMDSRPAVYLGRPCYFVQRDSQCSDDRWWTSHRYSVEVVESMSRALDQVAAGYDSLRLFGHSGGGTLAYLLAAQRDDVDALVTLGANLNLSLWAREHRYAPLYGSQNPVNLPPLPARVRQSHYLGSLDVNVRPEMIRSVIAQQPSATLEILAGVDHVCCWVRVWPELLTKISPEGG